MNIIRLSYVYSFDYFKVNTISVARTHFPKVPFSIKGAVVVRNILRQNKFTYTDDMN